MPKTPGRSTADHDNDNDKADTTKPTWDTSPNTIAPFILALRRRLPKQDARYRGLIEYGFATAKDHTYFCSTNHIDRFRHGLLTQGTWVKPLRIGPTDYTNAGFPLMETDAEATEARRGLRIDDG